MQLDRKLYVAVNEALAAMGGNWCRKTKGHIFPRDAQPLLDRALAAGSVVAADLQRIADLKAALREAMGYSSRVPTDIYARWCELLET